ncbi:MAG TPA: hypothetical protein VF519_15295 [Mycobacteriales bacterium]|jgi:hypothetical protein
MRRFLALTAVAASLALPATAQAATCGGVLDVNCYGTTCWTDCFSGQCTVWIDARHSSQTALCVL